MEQFNSSVIRQRFEEGERLHQAGKHVEAARHYQRVLATAPEEPRTLHRLALIEYDDNQARAAIVLLERAVQQEPGNAVMFNDLGLAYERQGQNDEALRNYARAVELMPEYADALINLGNALAESGQIGSASALYERAIVVGRNDARPYYNLGLIQHESGKLDAAWDNYEMAVALQPNMAQAWVNLAVLAQTGGRARGVIECYQQALDASPKLGEALHGLARWNSEQGTLDAAYGLYMRLGRVRCDERKWAEARSAFQQAVHCCADDADALAAIGYSAFHQGDLDTASEYARLALRVNCKLVQALYLQGRILRAQGAYASATSSFMDALAHEPTHTESLRALSELEVWRGDFAAASESYRRGVHLEPEQADWSFQLARTLVQSGRYEEADQSYTHAIAIDPGHATAYVERASIRLLHGVLGAGWRDREWRIQARGTGRYLPDPRDTTSVLLRPSTLLPANFADRSVLLVVDERDEEEHLFARFIPMLKARGAWIAVWGANKLKLDIAPLQAIDKIIEVDDVPPDTDFSFGLGELPMVLGVNKASEVVAPPLLVPDAGKIAAFRLRLRDKYGNEPVLAVTWASLDSTHRRHALMAQQIAPVVSAWGGPVVTLQPHVHYSELNLFSAALGRKADDISEWIESESDALALVAALDNYITVAQRWFQMRAGLHRPTHVLVAHPAPWCMLASGNRTPWWPSARLYRQTPTGDWSEALALLQAALTAEWTSINHTATGMNQFGTAT